MTRLDKYLHSSKLVKSRQKAQELIKAGKVLVNGQCVLKSSYDIQENETVEVTGDDLYVGRGALKLVGAIKSFQLDFNQKIVGDFGASTGGFTQVALINGAKKVYAIDVGHGQLDQSLILRDEVVNLEGVNIKDGVVLPEKIDMAVCDLSFISIKLVLKNIFSCLKDSGSAIVLYKPQFEVGINLVGKNGIVKEKDGLDSFQNFYQWCMAEKYFWKSWTRSPIQGKQGNFEYLVNFDLNLAQMAGDFYCLKSGEIL